MIYKGYTIKEYTQVLKQSMCCTEIERGFVVENERECFILLGDYSVSSVRLHIDSLLA